MGPISIKTQFDATKWGEIGNTWLIAFLVQAIMNS